jgi:integrase
MVFKPICLYVSIAVSQNLAQICGLIRGPAMGRLTARKVETAKPGKYGDGAGLQLSVAPTGAKKWVLRFLWQGKAREMGLGSYPEVGLSEAREKALAGRRLARSGGDPIAERKKDKRVPTFGELADEVVAEQSKGFRNEKHKAQWAMTLREYAASLRAKLVDAITTEDILAVLKPIWTTKAETASRLRGRIERVLNAAKAKGYRSGENPAVWRGHLENLLPKRQKLTRGHHTALPYVDVPGFVAKLRKRDAVAALALEFAILTAARSGEVLGARWREIDFGAMIWTIPPERMKAAREHRIPLSKRAVANPQQFEQGPDERARLSRLTRRPTALRDGDGYALAPHGSGRDRAWLPIELPRLGGQRDALRARARRTCACSRLRRQSRAGLPAIRRSRKAPGAHGRLGRLLRAVKRRQQGHAAAEKSLAADEKRGDRPAS